VRRVDTPVEEVLKRQHSQVIGVTARVDRWVKRETLPDAAAWVCQLTARLAAGLKNPDTAPRSCNLIQPVESQWRSYAIPGEGLYLSTAILRGVRLEAEVAALIAIELSHLDRGLLLKQLEPSASLPPNLSIDAFSFSEEEELDSVDTAVDLLYQVGYDPRALVSLLQFFDKNRKSAPYSSDLIKKLIEKSRRTIALRAPLSNPILRSAEFARIQKGIRKL
jgi:predicted Zn-dependent protease